LTLALIAGLAVRIPARELPVRAFTTVDGLSDDRVGRIVLDSRGLLWFCTSAGLTRFDGSQFQSFTEREGLPFPAVNDLLETPSGDFWLATNGGGVIRFPGSAAPRPYEAFTVSREPTSNRVNRFFRAPDGAIWVGTDGGLFRMTLGTDTRPAFSRVALRLGHPDEMVQVWSFVSDPEGSLWVGTRFGLVRILRDGRTVHYAVREDLPTDNVLSLAYTPQDRLLWIGHQTGLALFKTPAVSSYGPEQGLRDAYEDDSIARSAGLARRHTLDARAVAPHTPGDALFFVEDEPNVLSPATSVLIRSEPGVVDVLTRAAIFEFSAGRVRQVLADSRVQSVLLNSGAEDKDGNLWAATQGAGVLRIARHGWVTFHASDGLGESISDMLVDRSGDMIAVSDDWVVSRFDGQRFHPVRLNVPASVRRGGRRSNGHALQDHAGDWWFATRVGLVRFSGIRRMDDLATAFPRVYTTADGLAQDDVTRLFEDSRGDIWIGSLIPGRQVLTRWDRASGQFQRFSDADGLRAFNAPSGFYEDSRGAVWINFRDGGIARYEAGRFRVLTEANGLPPAPIGWVTADRAGRVWWCSRIGLYRVDDLNTTPLRPVLIASSNLLRGVPYRIAEDAFGTLYAFTPAAVVRLSTAGGAESARVTGIFTANDGVVRGEMVGLRTDREGRLWLASAQGLSYYVPTEQTPASPPAVRIGGVRAGGVERAISPAGEENVSNLDLLPGRSQLQVDFFGISFATGDTPAFEHRLVGAEEEWSSPGSLRSLLYSNLAPGTYTFEVRAVSSSGARSPQPARLAFRVLPPVWRRWWFITAFAIVGLTGVTMFEHYRSAHRREISRAREARLAELEEVRRRIAADLHDEIGSSLTQISILSEVARRQGAETVPQLVHPLHMIATSSRELVDAMSDIVWAINPAKDHLADLTQRMRRLASDAFSASSVSLQLQLPPPDLEITVGASVRREVFLIFKEAVNNIVKHAQCTEARILLGVEGAVLRLEVHDNGTGFDPLAPSEGHGLASLRHRAAGLGGSLTVVSAPGAGTAITLHLPIPT
jgi:signal transduction histidine kinase/ligand-binding sensor domain-containing protein